jgi:hypothetical protein
MLWEFNQHRENLGGHILWSLPSNVFEAVGGRWKLAAQLQKAVSQLGLCPDGYDHQDHPLNSDSQPCVWNKAFQWHLALIPGMGSQCRRLCHCRHHNFYTSSSLLLVGRREIWSLMIAEAKFSCMQRLILWASQISTAKSHWNIMTNEYEHLLSCNN